MLILKRVLLLVAAGAFALTASLAYAQTTPTVSCEDVKNACTIARKAAEQGARDTNEGCQDNCATIGGSNLSACQAACLAAKAAVVGSPGVLGSAATAYATCIATTCTKGEGCEEQAENSRHDCDEAARDTASTSIHSDPNNAQIYLANKNSSQASCAAAEATTRATVCSVGVDCVKSCGETEHACSEASRDTEKNCRVACKGDATCRATCEAARDKAVGTCLTAESSCVTACVAPPVVCPCAAAISGLSPTAWTGSAFGGSSAGTLCEIQPGPIGTSRANITVAFFAPGNPSNNCSVSDQGGNRIITISGIDAPTYNACETAIQNYYAGLPGAGVSIFSPAPLQCAPAP